MTNAWMRCSIAEKVLRALALLALAVAAGAAEAHKASDAYVQLRGGPAQATQLRVDVALRDLDAVLDLDADGDSKLTWLEVRTAWPAIEAYVHGHIQLDSCELSTPTRSLERRADGVYAALQWNANCTAASPPSIRYSMLIEVDPTHRGLASVEWAGRDPELRVLEPRAFSAASLAGASDSEASTSVSTFQFLKEGVHHILAGYDHLLFLLCLLLPSVLRREPQGWRPVEKLSQAVWPVAGIVTAFTLAHSVTLVLAATGLLSIPSSIIEPAIALTIILAALDNIWPLFRGRRVIVTFLFGLIHGFGFAGVLAELDLPAGRFAWALLQFNLGLELGQLVIVCFVTAWLFLIRRWDLYPVRVVRDGSIVAAAIGAIWLVERTTHLSLLPSF